MPTRAVEHHACSAHAHARTHLHVHTCVACGHAWWHSKDASIDCQACHTCPACGDEQWIIDQRFRSKEAA